VKLGIRNQSLTKLCSAAFTACGACLAFILLVAFHPYYVSVTEIKYVKDDESLQISCKTFTNDLEHTLRKLHNNQKIDLLHPKNKEEMDKILSAYVSSHLKITVNGKAQTLTFIGYEKEEESVWIYLEAKNTEEPRKMHIEDSILYEYLPQQINMVHTESGEKKQSSKVTNPDKAMDFSF
jgi:hypothetical protein